MTDCNNLENLEKIIGYTFNDKKYLIRSITHSSYAHEKHVKDNETMEFLGDAILNFVITEDLYKNFGNKYKEGLLSKARSK
ncbi:MAG: ribonuclease III, partial [Clostridia bacterium]|nr:ribonuclease III [Clostridia bacterium]